MAKLVLNLSMLGRQATGLGVYSENCAFAVAKRYSVDLIVGQSVCPSGSIIARAPASISLGAGKLAAIRRQLWMRSLVVGRNDLVYSPTHHGLPNAANQVVTVHDLIALRFPKQHPTQYLFFRFVLPKLLQKCKGVFTVSQTSREDIAEAYKFPSERIFVVPNGVDTETFKTASIGRRESPFLLMVGARYPHKNVEEVLEFSRHWSDTYRLVIASCGGRYQELLERKVKNLGLVEKVQFLNYVSREELVQLYQGCAALLYPSKWEGFGIPPLEALACGTPVIASDIPVHREILGEAAFYIRLGDEESWSDALQSLLYDEVVAEKLSFGRELAGRFTWAKSAEKLERSLEKIEPKLLRLQFT